MPSLPRPTRDPSRCHAGPACRRPFSPVPRLPLSRCPADTRAPLVSSFFPAETPVSLLRPRRASLPRGPSRASQGHPPAAHLFWKFLPSSAHLKSWNEICFPRAVTTAAILAGITHGHAHPNPRTPFLNAPWLPPVPHPSPQEPNHAAPRPAPPRQGISAPLQVTSAALILRRRRPRAPLTPVSFAQDRLELPRARCDPLRPRLDLPPRASPVRRRRTQMPSPCNVSSDDSSPR